MITANKNTLTITIISDNPDKLLKDIRDSLTVVTSILVESDEFNFYPEIPDALATLIRFNGELSK